MKDTNYTLVIVYNNTFINHIIRTIDSRRIVNMLRNLCPLQMSLVSIMIFADNKCLLNWVREENRNYSDPIRNS